MAIQTPDVPVALGDNMAKAVDTDSASDWTMDSDMVLGSISGPDITWSLVAGSTGLSDRHDPCGVTFVRGDHHRPG